jgi:hypothetical protein
MNMFASTAVNAECTFYGIFVSLYRGLPLVLILTDFLYELARLIAFE